MGNCSDGDLYIRHTGFKIVLVYQIVPCILGIFTNGIFLARGRKGIYFHSNLKFIISCALVFHLIFSLVLGVLQSVHFYLFVTRTDPCDVYVPVAFCLSIRSPSTFSQLTFVPFNVAMIIERTVATIRLNNYENSLKRLRFVLLPFVLLWALAMTLFSLWHTPLTGVSPYCSAANPFTSENISINSYFLSCVEVATIVWFFILWHTNKRLQKKTIFNFRCIYQINENLNALKLLSPWIISHFVVFNLFYLGNAITPLIWADRMDQKTAYAVMAFVPYYTMLTPFLLSYIVWQQKTSRVEHVQRLVKNQASGNAYMEYLNKQW